MATTSERTVDLFGQNEEPYGLTWGEWTTRWWKWYLSLPGKNNLLHDEANKEQAHSDSDIHVLFLAGIPSSNTRRTIVIPMPKAILFPVINYTTSFSENPHLLNEDEMIANAKANIDDIGRKEVQVDGTDLMISDRNRVGTPPFNLSFAKNNIYGIQEGPTRGVGDGYWAFLKPLCRGTHNIRSFGSCLSGKIQYFVNVKLIINEKMD